MRDVLVAGEAGGEAVGDVRRQVAHERVRRGFLVVKNRDPVGLPFGSAKECLHLDPPVKEVVRRWCFWEVGQLDGFARV